MIDRTNIDSKDCIKGYHTQECRGVILTEAIECKRSDAWLGVGSYFWLEEDFAHVWGKAAKTKFGKYDIYESYIDENNILNASFNEEEYYFFVKSIEKARKHLAKTLTDITLKKVHAFLADKIWKELGIKGIIFDDIPHNTLDGTRVYSDIKPLYYKKRLQIVIFDKKNIITFAPYILNEKCI